MLNKNAKKIIASFLVIGAMAGTVTTATTEASERDHHQKPGQRIEYVQYNHKQPSRSQQKAYMKKVQKMMKQRNVHVPPGHWAYGRQIPQRVLVQYREAPKHNWDRYENHDHDDDNDNDLLLGLILGAVIAEAADND